MWKLIQVSIVVGLVYSNMMYHWTSNGYLPVLWRDVRLRPQRDMFRLASLVAKEALDKPAAQPTAVAIMRPLALALFAGAMYLICWGVAAGAQRWGIVFPLGVVALELIVARAIDRRSSLGGG